MSERKNREKKIDEFLIGIDRRSIKNREKKNVEYLQYADNGFCQLKIQKRPKNSKNGLPNFSFRLKFIFGCVLIVER